jgi:hypothetical protein
MILTWYPNDKTVYYIHVLLNQKLGSLLLHRRKVKTHIWWSRVNEIIGIRLID